jgi:hypothetical protein
MAQVLSTFQPVEQSRFEAFRRCTFPSDAISQYVAYCLQQHYERTYARTTQAQQLTDSQGIGVSDSLYTRVLSNPPSFFATKQQHHKQQQLSDLCAVGQAEEITAVVSACAKLYAQRLVTAARRVAMYVEGMIGEDDPLLPHHVLQAHAARVKVGVDPGFFLQGSSSSSRGGNSMPVYQDSVGAAALGTICRGDLLRNAALEAQEEYDRYTAEQKNEGKGEEAEPMQVDGGDDDKNESEQKQENEATEDKSQ